jgi:hypothetical protein
MRRAVGVVAHDEHDALRQGDRQTGVDAAEIIAWEVIAAEVVDPSVVREELEVDAILIRPDRKPIGHVHQDEGAREDLLDVVAVQHQGKFGAQAEPTTQAERGKRIAVLGDARVQERARMLCARERIHRAQTCPRPLREMLRLLRSLGEAVAAGVVSVADGVPERELRGGLGE